MKFYRRCRFVLLATALACCAAPAYGQGEAAGEAVAEAREHFNRGVEFFREGNFRAALIEFQRTTEVAPNYRIQFNLGQTYFELQDYAGAMKAFEKYLKEGGNEIPTARRAEVEKELQKLRGRVAQVSIKTDVPGAEILVDDTVVGTTPLDGPILVSAGRRKISATKGRGLPTTKYVEIAGGDAIAVELVLQFTDDKAPVPVPAPATTPTTETPTAEKGVDGGMGTGFWVSLVATGVFATGATITGIMASGAKSDYDNELKKYPTTASDVHDARDRTDTLALTTDILGGAAVAAGVLTIVFAASGPDEPAATAKLPNPDVRVGVGPGSFVVNGRF